MELKTGAGILEFYRNQEQNLSTFKALEELIDEELEKAKSFPVEKPSSVAEPNPTFGQWIDVKVLLPNVDERVLLYVDDLHIGEEENNSNKILFGYLRKSGKIKPDGCLGDYNVTKWMPLPKL